MNEEGRPSHPIMYAKLRKRRSWGDVHHASFLSRSRYLDVLNGSPIARHIRHRLSNDGISSSSRFWGSFLARTMDVEYPILDV